MMHSNGFCAKGLGLLRCVTILGSGQSGERKHDVTKIDDLRVWMTLLDIFYTGEQRHGMIAQ